MPQKKSKIIFRGILMTFLAALVWGVGNFVTGLTAQKYKDAGSLFPAVDISIANVLGGIIFLVCVVGIESLLSIPTTKSPKNKNYLAKEFFNIKSIFAGIFKGLNTCLFVFSTTYIVATQALIFESTYVVWSLLFYITLIPKSSILSILIKVILLFLGIVLTLEQNPLLFFGDNYVWGALFGLAAGLSYALYLVNWSKAIQNVGKYGILTHSRATLFLLSTSLITILIIVELFNLIFFNAVWVPFTTIENVDILVQFTNGIFVIGIVYLLITKGLHDLDELPYNGASFFAALLLSFSIPFTLIPEFAIGKFIPSIQQLIGIGIFMILFARINSDLTRTT